jgi:hypothetical protein
MPPGGKGNGMGPGGGGNAKGGRPDAPTQDASSKVPSWRTERATAKAVARTNREAEAAAQVSAYLAADGTDISEVSEAPTANAFKLASDRYMQLAKGLNDLPEAKALVQERAARAKALADSARPLAEQVTSLERAVALKSKEHARLAVLLKDTQMKLDRVTAEGMDLEQKLDAAKTRLVSVPGQPPPSVPTPMSHVSALEMVSNMSGLLNHPDEAAANHFQACLQHLATLVTQNAAAAAAPVPSAPATQPVVAAAGAPVSAGVTQPFPTPPPFATPVLGPHLPSPTLPSAVTGVSSSVLAAGRSGDPRPRGRARAVEEPPGSDGDGFISLSTHRSRSCGGRLVAHLRAKSVAADAPPVSATGLRYFSQLAQMEAANS